MAIQAAVLPLLLPGPDNYDGDLCISAANGLRKDNRVRSSYDRGLEA